MGEKKLRVSILIRIGIMFIIAMLLSMSLCMFLGRKPMMERVAEHYMVVGRSISSYLTGMIDTSKPFTELSEAEIDQITSVSRQFCRCFHIKYVYIIDFLPNGDVMYFTVATSDDDSDKNSDDEDENEFVQKLRPFKSVVEYEPNPLEKSLIAGEIKEGYQFIDNEYGKVCSCLFEVSDKNGEHRGFVCVEDDTSEVQQEYVNELKFILILEMILFSFAIALSLILIRQFVTKPIIRLSARMRSFIENKWVKSTPRAGMFYDEVTDIENSFDKMADDIAEYVKELRTLSLENARNETQLEVARKIQCDIVPLRDLLIGNGCSIYGMEQPAVAVGGDFYDFFYFNDKEVCMMVGDISGKGISAAMFMVMVRTSIRNYIRNGNSPAQTLNLVNLDICRSNSQEMFATVFLMVMDTETGLVHFANAGHEAPLILSREPDFLKPENGIAVGLFADADYVDEELVLQDGEGILVFTDGITESIDKDKMQYGDERLRKAVVDYYALNDEKYDVEGLVNSLIRSVKEFSTNPEQFDDITCAALVFRNNEEDRMILPPTMDSFAKLRQIMLDNLGQSEKTLTMIMACEELFSNIVNYSGTDIVSICFEKVDSLCSVKYVDNGVEFNPVKAAAGKKDFLDLDAGGMGIMLAKRVSRDMLYKRFNGENRLIITFDI